MSDYQAYLLEITTEFPQQDDDADDEEASAERVIADIREAHRIDNPHDTFPPTEDGEAGALYREWNRRNKTTKKRKETSLVARLGGHGDGVSAGISELLRSIREMNRTTVYRRALSNY